MKRRLIESDPAKMADWNEAQRGNAKARHDMLRKRSDADKVAADNRRRTARARP